jgi:hypothetical protein
MVAGPRYRLSRQPRTPRFGRQQGGEAARNLDFWLLAGPCWHHRDAVDEPAQGLSQFVIALDQVAIGVVGQSFDRPQVLIAALDLRNAGDRSNDKAACMKIGACRQAPNSATGRCLRLRADRQASLSGPAPGDLQLTSTDRANSKSVVDRSAMAARAPNRATRSRLQPGTG